eukprot:TRINITY_DN98095_c0_g1_i1.p1 TRINITY_DN98095_c0_g1~~TRINITY_DN98095_c0_g1_i1.p1  ORF type:complete len:130 (+),score=7.25 TRINITY_DN98095_c0_g1_i1:127-516(+)
MSKEDENNPDVIINTYKRMSTDCQAISSKISELQNEKDEHKLVIDLLGKLEPERKAFRLIGGVLTERTVGEVSPVVADNFEGIKKLIESLQTTLNTKDADRLKYKQKHGIMTQQEREITMKNKQLANKE